MDSACPFYLREWQAIQLLAEGSTPGEIGLLLDVEASTVRKLLAAARARINVRTDEHLVAECYERGWLKTREHLAEIEEWSKITPAQRAYLDAFDGMLKTRFGSEEERRGRLEMRYMLGAMCIEKDIPIPGAQPVLALAA